MSEPIAGNPMADDLIERLWQDLLEKDDRTSPAEYPDMALITFDEFEAAARISRPSITAEAVAWRWRFIGYENWNYANCRDADLDATMRIECEPLFTHPTPEGAGEPGDLVERLKWLCDPSAEAMPERERLTAFVHAGIDTLSVLTSLRAERDAWAKNALDNDDCRIMWQARAEVAEVSLAAEKQQFQYFSKLAGEHRDELEAALVAEKQRVVDLEQHAKDLEGVITARSANEIDALHAFEQRVAEMEQYAREATKAITSLTVGGSEYFGRKIGEMYTADLALCVQHVRERDARTHDWMTKAVSERKVAEWRVADLEGALKASDEFRLLFLADSEPPGLTLDIDANDLANAYEQAERLSSAALRPAETGEPT